MHRAKRLLLALVLSACGADSIPPASPIAPVVDAVPDAATALVASIAPVDASAPEVPAPIVEPIAPIASPPPIALSPASPPACAVRLHVTLSAQAVDARRLSVRAENLTDQPVALDVPRRCDGSADVTFDLDDRGAPYDVADRCLPTSGGPCGQEIGTHVTIKAHGTFPVTTTSLHLRGAPCNDPLSPGTHTIRATLPHASIVVCGDDTSFDVPSLPPPPPYHSSDPRACMSSADCEVFCPQAPGCCSSAPCGCHGAINRAHEAEVNASFAKTCARAPCTAMGCAYQPAGSATCRAGKCVMGAMVGGR